MSEVRIPRSFDRTGDVAKTSRVFGRLPESFIDAVGGSDAEKFMMYVNELADGDDDNLDNVIELLEKAYEEADSSDDKKELMTLINEVNDFIVQTQQNGSTTSRLNIQSKFQEAVIDSNVLDNLIETEFDPLDPDEATGDTLGAMIKDFTTERIQTKIALNKEEIEEELQRINDGDTSDQEHLQELLDIAETLYDKDGDQMKMLQEILSGFRGLDYNVKKVEDGKVTEVQAHDFSHGGGARDTEGANQYRVREWVEDEGDSFTRSSSDNDDDGDDESFFDYISDYRNQRDRLSERTRRANDRRAQRNWAARTPHGYYTGGPAWNPGANSPVNGIINSIGGNILQLFLFGHAFGRTILDGFGGNLSSSIFGSPHGLHWETTQAYNTGGYHQYPVPSLGGGQDYFGTGSNSRGTNTPVNTYAPNTFTPVNALNQNIPGLNNNSPAFPYVYC